MVGDVLWSMDAEGVSVSSAIGRFVMRYWAQPRKAVLHDDGVTFHLLDGAGRVYQLQTRKGPHGFRVHEVFVLKEAPPLHPKPMRAFR